MQNREVSLIVSPSSSLLCASVPLWLVSFRLHISGRKAFHALLDEPADLLEARMAGPTDPFKGAALTGRQDCPGPFQPAQGNVVVDAIACPHRVHRNVDAEVQR